jgi:hypothetical protein
MKQQSQHTKWDLLESKKNLPLEMDREPGKLVTLSFSKGVFFIWSLLLERGVRSQRWGGLFTYL